MNTEEIKKEFEEHFNITKDIEWEKGWTPAPDEVFYFFEQKLKEAEREEKYEHKMFSVDIGALDWSVQEQWDSLIKDLNDGWEIIYHYEDGVDWPIFFLRRAVKSS